MLRPLVENSLQPHLSSALLQELVITLYDQNEAFYEELNEHQEESLSGGGFSRADRLCSTFNAQNHAIAEPLSSNSEYDRFGIIRTESRTY